MAIASAVSTRWRFWLAAAVAFVLILWLLNDILLPFVVGMAVAYFLDPVVARLQRLGMSRTWATTTVTIFAVLLAEDLSLYPLLYFCVLVWKRLIVELPLDTRFFFLPY